MSHTYYYMHTATNGGATGLNGKYCVDLPTIIASLIERNKICNLKRHVLVKLRFYITRYPILGNVQNAFLFTPCKYLHSNAKIAYPGSIQPRSNYCAKIVRARINCL